MMNEYDTAFASECTVHGVDSKIYDLTITVSTVTVDINFV